MAQLCELHDMVSDTLVFYEQTKSALDRDETIQVHACMSTCIPGFVCPNSMAGKFCNMYSIVCLVTRQRQKKNVRNQISPSLSADCNKAILRLTESDAVSNNSSLSRGLTRRLNPAHGVSEPKTLAPRDRGRYARLLFNTHVIRN